MTENRLIKCIQEVASPLTGSPNDYDRLMSMIGDARFVLLGEATHGTHEFYHARAEITKLLIERKGFSAVAIEGDWPDAYRINRFIRNEGGDLDSVDALGGFERFPTWMWRNADVLDFVGWLRDHNDGLESPIRKVGFYGLDLYSLYSSAEAVIRYLEDVDPEAAHQARQRYSCFEIFGEDTQAYAYAAGRGIIKPCEDQAIGQLVELHRQATTYLEMDGRAAEDELFYAQQNARLVRNAEVYYRTMFHGGVSSWNLRDKHMAETLSDLSAHLGRRGDPTGIIVWAHNSHVGDARATEMGKRGEWNIGELTREMFGDEVFNVGFTTFEGTVTAASNWDEPPERKRVRPALYGSYELLFHNVGVPAFLLPLSNDLESTMELRRPRLERAIGVIYRPETERHSHYFYSHLSDQFDAVIHFDHTRAVEPLERATRWKSDELPETFPTAI